MEQPGCYNCFGQKSPVYLAGNCLSAVFYKWCVHILFSKWILLLELNVRLFAMIFNLSPKRSAWVLYDGKFFRSLVHQNFFKYFSTLPGSLWEKSKRMQQKFNALRSETSRAKRWIFNALRFIYFQFIGSLYLPDVLAIPTPCCKTFHT